MLIFSNTYLVDNQCICIKNKGRSWYDKQHLRMGVKYHVCIPSSATSGRGKGHFPCSLNIHGIILEVARNASSFLPLPTALTSCHCPGHTELPLIISFLGVVQTCLIGTPVMRLLLSFWSWLRGSLARVVSKD